MVMGRVDGVMASDVVSLGNLTTDINIGLIDIADGNEFMYFGSSGTLGLAPGWMSVFNSTHGGRFIPRSSSDDQSFSLYLNGLEKDSYMTIPSYDTENYELIKKHYVPDEDEDRLNTWNLNISSMSYGD